MSLFKKLQGTWLILGVVSLLCFSACMIDSIESRINEQPTVFAAYKPEVQARLRQGQVRLGDDQQAVWFVYGTPTEKMRRTSLSGDTETWVYKIIAYAPELHPYVRPLYRTDRNGHDTTSYYIDNTPDYTWKEVLRVEFTAGKVSAVQMVE